MGYIGNEPTTGHFPVDNFTSSGGSTYTLAKAPASAGAIEVSVQGVLQPTTAYTVSGTTLTMAGVTTGVKIFVRHLGETLVLPTPADGSVTTAKLGVNSVDGTKIAMGSDARGDILYHGATDYARLAKGTSGQVLTMGANDPAWAAAAAGGAWNFLSTVSATGASNASLDITTGIDNTYKIYKIEITDIVPDANNVYFALRMGDSSGFDSGASDYSWAAYGSHSSTNWAFVSNVSDDADSYIPLCVTLAGGSEVLGNAAGKGLCASLTLNRSATGVYPSVRGSFFYQNAPGNEVGGTIIGQRTAGITLDRVQVFVPSGTTATGSMSLYGLSTS